MPDQRLVLQYSPQPLQEMHVCRNGRIALYFNSDTRQTASGEGSTPRQLSFTLLPASRPQSSRLQVAGAQHWMVCGAHGYTQTTACFALCAPFVDWAQSAPSPTAKDSLPNHGSPHDFRSLHDEAAPFVFFGLVMIGVIQIFVTRVRHHWRLLRQDAEEAQWVVPWKHNKKVRFSFASKRNGSYRACKLIEISKVIKLLQLKINVKPRRAGALSLPWCTGGGGRLNVPSSNSAVGVGPRSDTP